MNLILCTAILFFVSLRESCGLKTGDVPPGRYDRTADLIDRTVYIEYLQEGYDNYWVSKEESSKYVYMRHIEEQNVYQDEYIRLQAINCGDGYICLRSRWSEFDDVTNYPYYLDTSTSKAYFSNPSEPLDYNIYWWKIFCTSDVNFESCYICDVTYTESNSEWMCLVKDGGYTKVANLNNQYHNWRILMHKAVDNGYTENHYDICNDLEATINVEYKYCVGIQVPLFSGWTVSSSMAAEIREAVIMDIVNEGDSAHIGDWANEINHAETFSQETCTTISMPVPAHSAVTVNQLTATYGPYLVKSQKLYIEEKDFATCT